MYHLKNTMNLILKKPILPKLQRENPWLVLVPSQKINYRLKFKQPKKQKKFGDEKKLFPEKIKNLKKKKKKGM